MSEQVPIVLVIGDVMLDRRLEGEMHRISPEAPVPVVDQRSVLDTPGGAANVAANLAALGCVTFLLGVIGDDPEGQRLRLLLQDSGVRYLNLLTHPNVSTITKTKVTVNGQQVLRIDRESGSLCGMNVTEHEQVVLAAVAQCLQSSLRPQLIICSDYCKGTFTHALAASLVELSRANDVPLFVDTKPSGMSGFAGATLVKPNLSEARRCYAHNVHPALAPGQDEEAAVQLLSRLLYADYNFGQVVITRSGNGASFFNGQEFFTSSVQKQEVFDVTGAGDTFLAVLADTYLRTQDWPSAMLRANTAASEAVRHYGTTKVSRDQLDDAVMRRRGLHGKILTVDEGVRFVTRQRRNGRRIVLTNGCFRVLHEGHWQLLQWARRQGDVLIVAANSDSSIRQLRGADTKFIPAEFRGQMLASAPGVDAVVFFDEPVAEGIVRKLHPDILVKGAEYRDANVPGADWLAQHGGELRFAPMLNATHASSLLP